MTPTPTLIDEATRRSGVVWVSPPAGAPVLLWHLWHEDRMYVVGGGQEQPLPLGAGPALVTVRSAASRSGRVVEWAADVEAVRPGTALWEQVTPLLAAQRLNPPDRSDPVGRWARKSAVLRFTPVGIRPA